MSNSRKIVKYFLLASVFLIFPLMSPQKAFAQNCCTFATDCPPLDGYTAECSLHDPDCPVRVCGYRVFPLGCEIGSSPLDPDSGIKTAIGCITISDISTVISFFLIWSLGIGGGITIIIIVYAGFMIQTASGDPRRLNAGKELLMAALAGLLLIIFSVFMLRIIGFDILKIPGFGS